ncbi:PaaI family thioesterase [Methylogaea oryzae]|uniref:DUF4442 domain-containing protein n=1 Tax=Methylogaea oryzae TaxID=1295382 RepID=A0A8D5AIZ0_9GAMM|nr:PaaI family thioesterase [Methylogaea oryzae]BBL69511.1 hypothetical protein MoryE10_01170 [Methylogaea oryzae]
MNLRRLIWHAPFLSDRRKLEWFPPFWLMRIKVLEVSDGWRTVRVRLPQTWISRNAGGGLFGGFQAALADPVAPMACMHLFPGYAVWTRHLALDFQHEAGTDLELRFQVTEGQEADIRAELQHRGRASPVFHYAYYNGEGRLCTAVETKVAIRPQGYRKPGG